MKRGVPILLLCSALAVAQYENPVIRGVNPDPSICRARDDFYLVTSSMFLYPGVPVYHNKDLVNWRLIGHALTRPSHFWLDKNKGNPMVFAPTLRYHERTFYVITTEVHGGGNFYVTAKDPSGTWCGVPFGMYATGNGTPVANPADFDWFEHE